MRSSWPDEDARAAPAGSARWHDPWWLASLPLLLFLAVPLAAVLLSTTPALLADNLRKAQVIQAVTISLRTTLVTTAVTILFGTPLAYSLARGRVPARRAVDTLVELPIVLPPAVAGVALLITFGRQGLIGQWLAQLGWQVAFTPAAVVMAQLFVAAPFYVKAATIGFTAVGGELEQAAAIDGASGWQVFRHVSLPLAGTALVSGSVLTWARALGEFGATILFAGNLVGVTQTMPLAIYIGFELDLEVALTLAAILVVVSFTVLLLVKQVLHREAYNLGNP